MTSGAPVTSAETCDLLLLNGTAITMDHRRRIIDPGGVAVRAGRIVAVGAAEWFSSWSSERVVDCSGAAILPGLIDCHNHLFQSLSRGLGDGMALWTWLTELIWPYAAQISQEETRAAALLGAVEAVRSGTTSLLDNHYSPADAETTMAVAEAMELVGLRGVVARGIFGPMTELARRRRLPETLFRFTSDGEIAEMEACLDRYPAGGRLEIWPAPINPTYVDPDLIRRSQALAAEHGVRWHGHCSETRADVEFSLELHGVPPFEWLAREGLLENGTIAHGIWLNDVEIGLLAENRVAVSHCPVANQVLASGVIRLHNLRNAGVTVGLGTDGPAGGQRQDLFECMKTSVLLQRVSSLDPQAAYAEDALELATIEGARLLGIDAGELAPGKLADLIVVDLTGAHLRPINKPVSAIALSARGSDVLMTIVEGEVIFENGRCSRIDEDAVIEDASARASQLMDRLGIDTPSSDWVTSGRRREREL